MRKCCGCLELLRNIVERKFLLLNRRKLELLNVFLLLLWNIKAGAVGTIKITRNVRSNFDESSIIWSCV